VKQIFATYLELSVAPHQKTSRWIVEQLTEEEMELAARRSYAYYMTTLRDPKRITREIRFATAMREANRHMDGIGEAQEGLNYLRTTIAGHKDLKTYVYMTCMEPNFQYQDKEDAVLAKQRRERIIQENRDNQTMIIRGTNKLGQPVWVAMPRKKPGDDPQTFLDILLYTMERCAAIAEAQTLGRRDENVTILDLNKSSCPSLKALKMGLTHLQLLYPGRLKNLIALDLNYILQGMYNCIKPFLCAETKEKFIIVSGAKAKEAAVSIHLDRSQAQSNILQGGELSPDVDGVWFVQNIPFCRPYDYRPAETRTSQQNGVVVQTQSTHASSSIVSHVPSKLMRSPRAHKSTKSRSLAVGTIAKCMTRVTVISLST